MKGHLKTILIITQTILFVSCGNNETPKEKEQEVSKKAQENEYTDEDWRRDSVYQYSVIKEFPIVKKLKEYKRTEFVPTLESNLSNDKNSIYCVTLLYAWNKIKETILPPINIINPSSDLKNLNSSKSYFNVLDSNDYKVDVRISGDTIEAKANFNKSLPYAFRLSNFSGKKKLEFDKNYVSSFGVKGFEALEAEELKIAYYKDEDNFIIKLHTTFEDHEIFLFKTSKTFKTMEDYVVELNKKIEIGKKEITEEKTKWRYEITDSDFVYIPKLKFNIENNYETIEGHEIVSKKNKYIITTAWQRNAFILYEAGAGISSEADMVCVAAAGPIREIPKPKHMKFDKPFFIMLKKTDSKNPYFAMRILNSELMIIE